MLTRKTAEAIATTLTIQGQGETVTFDITFFNRSQAELEAKQSEGVDIATQLLFIIKQWDAEYPLSVEGIKEMEGDRPGITMALIEGYHEARKVEKVKN